MRAFSVHRLSTVTRGATASLRSVGLLSSSSGGYRRVVLPLSSRSDLARLYSTTEQQQNQEQTADGQQQPEGEQKSTQQPEDGQQQEPEAQLSETEKLQKRIKELEDTLREVNGDYLRSLADIDNMTRIGKTNVENAKLYSIKSFAEGMLEIADNLSRALDSLPEEKRQLPDVRTLFEGVAMTERVLQQVFARYGIKKFDPLNEKFDPAKCSALFEVQDPAKAPGTVAFVQAPGYTLHERLLRAAQVGVVAAPSEQPPSTSSTPPDDKQ